MLSTSCRYELGDGGRASESGRRMADIDCSTGGEQLISKNDTVQGVVSGADLARRDSIPTTSVAPSPHLPPSHPFRRRFDLHILHLAYVTLSRGPSIYSVSALGPILGDGGDRLAASAERERQ